MPACADVRLLVAQTSGCIALFGSEVTEHCGAVAVHGGRVANLTDFVASPRRRGPAFRGLQSRVCRPGMDLGIRTACEARVRGLLVEIRAVLIPVAECLIRVGDD